jgi:uncharacterized membrane protein
VRLAAAAVPRLGAEHKTMPLPVATRVLAARDQELTLQRQRPARTERPSRAGKRRHPTETTIIRDDQSPLPFHELRKLRTAVRPVNVDHKKALSRLDRLAVWMTERVGTMGFCLLLLAWTVIWLGWNTVAPDALRFDPYPAFVLWLFLSNMIQICLMPLIMLGQNLQGRHAEARAQADFEVNTKAEREIETILRHLERQNDLILKIVHHLEGTRKH